MGVALVQFAGTTATASLGTSVACHSFFLSRFSSRLLE